MAETLGQAEIGEIYYILAFLGFHLLFTIPTTHISAKGWAAHLLDGRDGFHLQLGNLSWLFHELDVPRYSVARHTCVLHVYCVYICVTN